jgi:hypothetical protein
MIVPIQLEKGADIKLEKPYARVFQFNESLLLVESESYAVLKVNQQLESEKEVKFETKVENMDRITVANLTPNEFKFSHRNLHKYPTVTSVPE